MSHRVTTKSEMKDRSVVEAACRDAGIAYSVSGNSVSFTSGPLRGSYLDLTTGDIRGDSDYRHTPEILGALRQGYSEAKVKMELSKQGGYVEERNVDSQGRVVLLCHVG